jgi:hypothetical protein
MPPAARIHLRANATHAIISVPSAEFNPTIAAAAQSAQGGNMPTIDMEHREFRWDPSLALVTSQPAPARVVAATAHFDRVASEVRFRRQKVR